MNRLNVKWKQEVEPPSFPKWLKSYHLLLCAVIVVVAFGAVLKHFGAKRMDNNNHYSSNKLNITRYPD
ncbi:hypothetical protein OHD16_19010 [Sphingobacterium sp. ML3W]|uniref:hypothetical protein n=1 Tax=Sphingobacterium sp. ML3W TaxID=1538644 RepID=UPI00249A3A98|nr:hypothetical protein [Sphingobacterium sp. ML3W]WFA82048.1 hypothetical protein OGI71_12150 [Sphingobacterium sp. ML3W]